MRRRPCQRLGSASGAARAAECDDGAAMTTTPFEHFPQPEWNDEHSVAGALDALRDAHEEAAADDAADRFLWAIGNNHAGTFHPVVLATLPMLEQLLAAGGPWTQRAVLEALIDLAGTFVPEPGHESYLGASVQDAVRAFVRSLREQVAPLVEVDDARRRPAVELVELIDDLGDVR
jgi:hypothetical protein